MLQRITSWSFRHRRLVVGGWLAVLIGINVASMAWGGDDKQDFLSPGTDSKAAVALLDERFPAQSGDTVTIVIHDAAGVTSPAVQAVAQSLVQQVRGLPHIVGVSAPWDSVGQISTDRQTEYATVQLDSTSAAFPVDVAKNMMKLAADARAGGVQVELGGQAIDNAQSASFGAEGPGLIIAAIILLIAFGSLVAMGLPLATALFGVGAGLAVVSLLANFVDTPEWADSVALMIGVGVGIDYALLIVTRYRSELATGASPASAIATAMGTAGRSVVFAATTVVIALLGMLTMNQPYVPGVAFSAVIVVIAVALAALTLLPALLGFAGRNIDRLRVPFLGRRSAGSPVERGFWYRWSRMIQHRPIRSGLLGTVVLAILIIPVFGLRLGFPDAGNDPSTLTTSRAYHLMADGFGAGFNGTFVLVADRGDANALVALNRLDATLAATPGVAAVSPAIASPNGDAAVITLTPVASPQSDETADLLTHLRRDVVPTALEGTDVDVVIGGATAANADQTASIGDRLPLFIAAVIGLAFILLLAVFRSVLVAVKAAILNLLSIIAAFGVVAYAAQGGWFGHLFGITAPIPVPAFIPMMMFAILFGLSMDYEVFLLSRIREEYLRSGDNSRAVADGLASTGKVITAAALIMTAVFGAFIFDDAVFLKIIGIGMAAAVIIDATVIRLVLVPATMQLLGDKNWWMPAWLDRILPRLDIEGMSATTTPADERNDALVQA